MTLSQITVVASAIEKQRLGYQAASLTNYDNDLEPKIAAGSKLEIGNALFEATADESITGWSGISLNSDVYIKIVPSGATATAEFVTAAPSWDIAKQGWYSGSARYIGGLRKDASGNYADKWLYQGGPGVARGGIKSDAIRTVHVKDDQITVAKLLKSLGSPGSHSLTVGTPWTPPAGLYFFSYTSPAYLIEFNDSGTWRSTGMTGGFAWCDGTNVRLTGSSGTVTVYYIMVQ